MRERLQRAQPWVGRSGEGGDDGEAADDGAVLQVLAEEQAAARVGRGDMRASGDCY